MIKFIASEKQMHLVDGSVNALPTRAFAKKLLTKYGTGKSAPGNSFSRRYEILLNGTYFLMWMTPEGNPLKISEGSDL